MVEGGGGGEVGGYKLTLLVEQRGRKNRSDDTNKGIQETANVHWVGDPVIYSSKIRLGRGSCYLLLQNQMRNHGRYLGLSHHPPGYVKSRDFRGFPTPSLEIKKCKPTSGTNS